MIISGADFEAIAQSKFGSQWKKEIANYLDLSEQRIYQLTKSVSIPAKYTDLVARLADNFSHSQDLVISARTISVDIKDHDENLTDQEILDRVNIKFGVMNRMVDGMVSQLIRSMIVYGAPGIGKTYHIELSLKKAHREQGLYYHIIKGACSAPGLYQALYHARKGGIVVLDDCDSIFNDEQGFNILKSALDSTKTRTLSWRKMATWVYDARREQDFIINTDDKFPNEFDFEGGVIFITNMNTAGKAFDNKKNSPNFQALISRSIYLDLTLNSQRAHMVRIRDVFVNNMRKEEGLSESQAEEILTFVFSKQEKFREVSLRLLKQICQLYKLGDDWKTFVEHTMMK